MKKIIYSTILLFLTALLLIYPKESLNFALNGLNLWFQRMVPTLFPFMIVSGIMIRMSLTDKIMILAKPFLTPLFRLRPEALYAITAGFMCGFPMGARIVADLYRFKQINKDEAAYLLTFVNNIGPIYFLSFALPVMNLKFTPWLLFGMYGIPLIYGLILRHTVFRNKLKPLTNQARIKRTNISLAKALDDSITSGIEGITKLGGYMIIFNLLNIIPYLLLSGTLAASIISGMLEITGGLTILNDSIPLISLTLVTFGGFSCFAQTYSSLTETDLSMKNYIIHKLILTTITGIYYTIIVTVTANFNLPF